MKKISKLTVLTVALAAGALFASCSEDENSKAPEFSPSIIGEWFEDASEGDAQLYSTTEIKEDGTLSMWFGYASSPQSLYFTYDGTYSYNDEKLTQRYVSPITGDNTTEEYDVKAVDDYTLTLYAENVATTSTHHRIVNTYNMSVGESKAFSVNDTNFDATSYSSTNNSIAQVDGSGNIVAMKRGMAFICANSSIGTAVIRVVVTDPDNVIDDFMSFIGSSITEVEKVYGRNYIEVPSIPTERTYALLDETTESVVFQHFSGVVLAIVANLRNDVNSDAIIESFSKKYNVENIGRVSARFNTVVDDQKYSILYLIGDGMITYMPVIETPEPGTTEYPSAAFEQFDNLITMGTATDAANMFGYQLTEENMEDGWFDIDVENEVFSSVTVMFDEDPDSDDFMSITSVSMSTKSGIKQEDIEYWYKEHYTATGDEKNPYSSSTNPVYYVSFKTSGSRTLVYYKFRKNR